MNPIETAISIIKINIEVAERNILRYETELECYENVLKTLELIKSTTSVSDEDVAACETVSGATNTYHFNKKK